MSRALSSSFLSLCLVVGFTTAYWRFPSHQVVSLSSYDYETAYFTQPIDHFGFDSQIGEFKQRYLVSREYWEHGKPIFFYAGNEGDITWFCNNTGFMWDIAPEFNAMLIFAEHRYYGKSLPFGSDSYLTSANLQYLTSEQALADFAVLIEQIKLMPGAENSSVVAFGGSYGGMLAAWLRMKYPNVVVGAIAASAPIWQFGNLTPCDSFNRIASQDYRTTPGGEMCFENIRDLWSTLNDTANQEHGMTILSSIFDQCSPVSDVNVFVDWFTAIFGYMAVVNYPYPASFLEPLPAWPVSVACSYLNESRLHGEDLLRAIRSVVNLYFNYTGELKCFNASSQGTSSLGDKIWAYQACTEQILPVCSKYETSMFPPSQWDPVSEVERCEKKWNVTVRPNWMFTLFGGKDIRSHSNIVFSNGNLDPWSGGGVLTNLSDTLTAIVMENVAHHLDLRASNPADPQTVIDARNVEKEHIRMWIKG
ncbi:lysosomal Pro-X carboxypeptidase-like [Oscarella lobularis]|uniref:lysosomal Pro-X carboxypeptidase-like n=1 Tax=Oscarella lobularis TaxID=121494 RepID=UPI003313322C